MQNKTQVQDETQATIPCVKTRPAFLPEEEELALIRRAAAGDEEAQERLLAQYMGLIVKESRQRYLRNAGLSDDAPSIASLAFLEAIRDFDASRGIHFAGFAASRVHTALYNAFRRERRRWDRETHPDQSADSGGFWERYGGAAERKDAEDEAACRRLLLREAMAVLTPREKQILRLIYFEEATLTKIAQLLNVTHQSVSKAKKKILNKLRISIGNGEEALAY